MPHAGRHRGDPERGEWSKERLVRVLRDGGVGQVPPNPDDPYVRGRSGPNAFDCSGLVRYSYRKAGVGAKLGGGNSARGMLRWARLRGLTGKRNPHVGDIVIYGNGSHAAIYIGRGRVVHALNPRLDIRVTRLHAMRTPFTTFIHMDRRLGG